MCVFFICFIRVFFSQTLWGWHLSLLFGLTVETWLSQLPKVAMVSRGSMPSGRGPRHHVSGGKAGVSRLGKSFGPYTTRNGGLGLGNLIPNQTENPGW